MSSCFPQSIKPCDVIRVNWYSSTSFFFSNYKRSYRMAEVGQLGCLGFGKRATGAKEGPLEFRGERDKGNAPAGRGRRQRPGQPPEITSCSLMGFIKDQNSFPLPLIIGHLLGFRFSLTINIQVISI